MSRRQSSVDEFAYLYDPSIPPREKAFFERLEVEVYQPTPSVCHLGEQWIETDPLLIQTIGYSVNQRNELLRTYARLFDLNPDDYDLEEYSEDAKFRDNTDYYPGKMIAAIQAAAPCSWIRRVERFLDSSPLGKYLYIYTTDYMIDIYKWIREGKITANIQNLVGKMNQAIYSAPRTTEQFMVYRISRYPIPMGDSMVFDTPKSGTFLMSILNQNYLQNRDTTLFRVWIPRKSILAYVPIDDQVVFPTGAEFLAVTEAAEETLNINGDEQTFSIQDVYYIGAPEEPLILLDELIFDTVSDQTFNQVIDKWSNDESFPFLEPYPLD